MRTHHGRKAGADTTAGSKDQDTHDDMRLCGKCHTAWPCHKNPPAFALQERRWTRNSFDQVLHQPKAAQADIRRKAELSNWYALTDEGPEMDALPELLQDKAQRRNLSMGLFTIGPLRVHLLVNTKRGASATPCLASVRG